MPNGQEVPPLRVMLGEAFIDFVRLPDDDRYPASMIIGVTMRRQSRVILRGVWDVDVWDHWKAHKWFWGPVPLSAEMSREDPGVVVKVSAVVPLREMPREQWPEEFRTEAWQAERQPPAQAGAFLPLGTLVRYARRFEHHGVLPDEGMAVIHAALSGRVQEPWEQGLSV
jgi:hypothetical protein